MQIIIQAIQADKRFHNLMLENLCVALSLCVLMLLCVYSFDWIVSIVLIRRPVLASVIRIRKLGGFSSESQMMTDEARRRSPASRLVQVTRGCETGGQMQLRGEAREEG